MKQTILFSGAYLVFSGLLMLAKFYLSESVNTPFYEDWYAQEKSEEDIYRKKRSEKLLRDYQDNGSQEEISVRTQDREGGIEPDDEDELVLEPLDPLNQLYREEEVYEIDKYLRTSQTHRTEGIQTNYGDLELRAFGRSGVSTSVGFATFLTQDDAKNDFQRPNSRHIDENLFLAADIVANLKGKLGKRLLVDIDYDQNEKVLDNKIQLKYFGLHKKEFVKEITVGNVDFELPGSQDSQEAGLVFQNRNQGKKTLGIESKFERGKFKLQGLASLTRGEADKEIFTGKTRNFKEVIPEYQYIARRYFQLEPFLYYDALNTVPNITSASYQRGSPNGLITFTSIPAADSFTPSVVNIDANSLEVWLDDRNGRNDMSLNAQTKLVSGVNLGIYHRLQESEDYKFNAQTGRIEFLNPFSEDSRIYVRYTRNGNASETSDPSVQTNVSGKMETFIYFEGALNEDINRDGSGDIITVNDGKINYDTYEVRGIYSLNAEHIQENRLQLRLVNRNRAGITGSLDDLGTFELDTKRGLLNFHLREPFKALRRGDTRYILDDSVLSVLYSERQISAGENSLVGLEANIVQDVQSYKLRHLHILENSVEVKIDGQSIDRNLYHIEHQLGFFRFLDPLNPVISENTRIEISYEYSPFNQVGKGFLLGLRSTYEAAKDIKLGNTLFYNGQFEPNSSPLIGEEPVSRFVIKNDLNMKLKEERLTNLVNSIPGLDFDLLPLRYHFYGDYNISFYNPNTVGRALVDDMESSEESISVSISDRDWQLSSLPVSLGSNECDRAPLLYRYFRDLGNIESGPTPFSVGARAEPAYSTLAGPYNVAEGHLDNEQLQQGERQSSLVLDVDFSSGGKVAAIAARKFSARSSGEDLSQIEYLEFSAKLQDASNLTGGVIVRIEVGTINEDADNDNVFDTEDVGLDGRNNDINGDGIPDEGGIFQEGEHNEKLDSVIEGYNEDTGYQFDAPPSCPSLNTRVGAGPRLNDLPRTNGNGVLNSEDLNGDGRLEKTENVVSFDELDRNYLSFDTVLGSSNTINSSDWSLVRMFINIAQLNDNQLQALSNARTVRIYILPADGSEGGGGGGKGKLLIDNIKFGSSKWRQKKAGISGIETELNNSRILSVSTVDNQDSRNEYKNESFINLKQDEYEDLHGKKNNTERARLREAALKLSYNFSSSSCTGGCEYAYVQRVFLHGLDISYYKKINIWVNYRELNALSDSLFLRLGSSDKDYIEMSQVMNGRGWRLLEFSLPEESEEVCGSLDNSQGCPNLKNINTMSIGIRNGSLPAGEKGVIWVNDIYVSETRIQSGDSYTIRNYLEVMKPLYKTSSGIPILDRMTVSYERNHQGKKFFTINQPITNVGKDEDNVQVRSKVLPFWQGGYQFSKFQNSSGFNELNRENDFDGNVTRVSHSTQHDFKFERKDVPEFTLKYEYSKRSIKKTEPVDNLVDTQISENNTEERDYAPSLILKEKFPEFWSQEFTLNVENQVRYYVREENAKLGQGVETPDSQEFLSEKQQTDSITSSLQYKWNSFSLTPTYSFRQVLLIQKSFANNQSGVLNGNFYFPLFISSDDYRYVQRDSRYSLKTGYKNLWVFSPQIEYQFDYLENSFRDNEDKQILALNRYQRLKRASTRARANFSNEFDLSKLYSKLDFIRSFKFSMFREMTLSESNVPFSRQSGLLKDDFGLSSRFGSITERTFNIFQYPIWHHFLSKDRHRNNLSNGREYIQFKDFRPSLPDPVFQKSFSQYSQSISLQENINTSIRMLPVSWLIIQTEAHLGQDITRSGDAGSLVIQRANWGVNFQKSYDLMKAFNFWFWKTHDGDQRLSAFTKKSSRLETAFNYDKNLLITNNISRDHYIPSITVTFGWFDRLNASHHIRVSGRLDFVSENKSNFFIENGNANDRIFYQNIQANSPGLRKDEIGWGFSIIYIFGIPALKRWLRALTKSNIDRNPEYRIEFNADFKRFNYELYTNLLESTFDTYRLDQRLDMNLNKYITGEIYLKSSLEIEREAESKQEQQKVLAFEIGLSVKIIF